MEMERRQKEKLDWKENNEFQAVDGIGSCGREQINEIMSEGKRWRVVQGFGL